MRIKKLLVLTGNEDVREEVLRHMFEMEAAKPVTLFSEPIEVLAKLLEQPLEKFTDPKKRGKAFGKGVELEATSDILRKFASRLSMGIIPITFASKRFKTPQEAMTYFFDVVGGTKWGKDWAVKRFYNEFAYIKSGVYVLTDGNDYLPALRDVISDGSLIVVRLDLIKSDGTVFDLPSKDRVDLIMQHVKDDKDYSKTTIDMLKTIRTKFFEKR
jgi:hypothetical protein